MTELPAGYVDLDGAAIHVSQLRQHTTDVRRFLACYPICRRLQKQKPGSDAWREVMRGLTADDIDGVDATMREAGLLFLALADDLERHSN